MKNYLVQEKYMLSYICWKCEKRTEHEIEKCLIGYGDDLELSYLSFCPECDKYEEFSDLSELEEKPGLQLYYLLDLERTLLLGAPYFWLQNKHGYVIVDHIENAGKFNEIEADRIVENDRDKQTIKIKVEVVNKILKI
jgi:hypothetical protein